RRLRGLARACLWAPLRRPFRLPLIWAAGLLDRCLQCLDEVHDLRRLFRLLVDRHRLTLRLLLDEILNTFAVLIVIPVWIEVGRHRIDQLLRHFLLAVGETLLLRKPG